MEKTSVGASDVFWWCSRFALLVLLSCMAWSCSPFVSEVAPAKLIVTGILAAVLLMAVLVHSFASRKPPWLYSLSAGGQPIRLSGSSALVVCGWLVAFWAFLWWFEVFGQA